MAEGVQHADVAHARSHDVHAALGGVGIHGHVAVELADGIETVGVGPQDPGHAFATLHCGHVHEAVAIHANPTGVRLARVGHEGGRILDGTVLILANPDVLVAIDGDGRAELEDLDVARHAGDLVGLVRHLGFGLRVARPDVKLVGAGKLRVAWVNVTHLGDLSSCIRCQRGCREHVAPIEGHADANHASGSHSVGGIAQPLAIAQHRLGVGETVVVEGIHLNAAEVLCLRNAQGDAA